MSSSSAPRSSTRYDDVSSRTPSVSPRAEGRPALQDPRAAAPRRREPHRPATREAQRLSRGRRPGLGRHRRLVGLPTTTSRLRRQEPSRGQEGRREGHRLVSKLPDPRGRAPRPNPARLAPTSARLLRHQRRVQRRHRSRNLLIAKTRRLAHGFRNVTNYRLRILLVADASRPYRTTLRNEEPDILNCWVAQVLADSGEVRDVKHVGWPRRRRGRCRFLRERPSTLAGAGQTSRKPSVSGTSWHRKERSWNAHSLTFRARICRVNS